MNVVWWGLRWPWQWRFYYVRRPEYGWAELMLGFVGVLWAMGRASPAGAGRTRSFGAPPVTRPVSERLRMLDETMGQHPWSPSKVIRLAWASEVEAVAVLRNALPALVAVVEAAEKVRDYSELEDDAHLFDAQLFDALPDLTDALSALSTALPGVEVEA